jgi:hypothetical protein
MTPPESKAYVLDACIASMHGPVQPYVFWLLALMMVDDDITLYAKEKAAELLGNLSAYIRDHPIP